MSERNQNKGIDLEKKSLIEGSFCVLPWLHLHVMPDSSVIPCCVSPYSDHYGNVTTETVEEIWNSQKYKKLRKDMLSGKLPAGCKHCHDVEAAGFSSMRKNLNRKFENQIEHFVENTSDDGTFFELKLKYIDIRFSNLCNLKCRGCGPALSSAWFDDHQKLFDYVSDKPKVRNVAIDSPEFWKRFRELVLDSEEIYFGGGEPLITKEHFDLLRLLIDKNKLNVNLSYNTNLSTLNYGNHNLVDLWKKFRTVNLGVSIDDLGVRAEYFRSGTKWSVVDGNLKKLRDEYRNINKYVNCTVNIMNVFYLPELFSYLVDDRIIQPNDFNINMLLDPEELRIDVLPASAKNEVKLKLDRFKNELQVKGWFKAASDFKNIISHMMEKDNSHLFPKFIQNTKKMDSIRSESFVHVYPELAQIMDYK